MLAAQIGHRSATFSLAQDRDARASVYLLVFIQTLLKRLAGKILHMQPFTFGEDYRSILRSGFVTVSDSLLQGRACNTPILRRCRPV